MSTLYLARHGQDADNAAGILNGHRDEPLTEAGEAQARQLAFGIKDAGITVSKVFTSPLTRAKRTGEIVADLLAINEVVSLESLIERDFGVMTGKHVSEIKPMCAPEIIETDTVTYFLCPEGAETFPKLLDRAAGALREVKEQSDGQPALVVGHGDLSKMMYAHHYDLPWEAVLTGFHYGNGELLHLGEYDDHSLSHILKLPQHNN